MMWLFGLVAVAVIGATFALASGRFGEMPELTDDHPVPRLPEGDFDADSLAAVRFATTTRGYHKTQVDALLKRAGKNLPTRDAQPDPAPSERLNAEMIRDATFDVVSGGYLMSQVDVVLERLARQFDAVPAAGEHAAEADSLESATAQSVSPGEYLAGRRRLDDAESAQSVADAE